MLKHVIKTVKSPLYVILTIVYQVKCKVEKQGEPTFVLWGTACR